MGRHGMQRNKKNSVVRWSALGLALLGTGGLITGLESTSLAQAKGKKALPSLAAKAPTGIHDPRVEVAAQAALALGKSKSPKAVPSLLDALALGLHPRVAAAALDALAMQRKPNSYDTLEFYMRHRSAQVRTSATKAMGTLSDKRAIERVLGALGDGHRSVRAAAAVIVATGKNKRAIEPLMILLTKGDQAAAPALAALANPELARALGEQIGSAPDGLLARCLGGILMRPDFKPEDARVEVVKALGKIPGNESLEQLTNYVGSLPENPPRPSRQEAERIVEARLSGD